MALATRPSGTARRDPAQWHGENLTRAAKDAWVALLAREDIMLPNIDGAAAPPFAA